jgi:Ca2+-binding EF-hand superfamily protein
MAEFLVMLHIDTNRFTKRAFSLIDSDNDGKVDFYEFVAAIWNYCTLDWESLVRFSFDLFDIDGSGELEINEIEKLVCYVAGKKKVDSRMRKVRPASKAQGHSNTLML